MLNRVKSNTKIYKVMKENTSEHSSDGGAEQAGEAHKQVLPPEDH
jgi:hypothetical protein